MRTTNRAVNRGVLLLAGLLLLAAATVAVLVLLPETREATLASLAEVRAQLERAVAAQGSVTVHAVGLVAAALVAVLAIVAAAARGGGRTQAIRDGGGTLPGTLELTVPFLQDVLRDQLGTRRELLGVDLSAWRDGGRTALLIRVQTRSGTDPGEVVTAVEDAVRAIDGLIETRQTVLVRLTSGARVAMSGADRVR